MQSWMIGSRVLKQDGKSTIDENQSGEQQAPFALALKKANSEHDR